MFGFDWNQIAAFGLMLVGGGGFLWSNRGAIKPWLPSFGRTAAAVPIDDDTADFQALTRLQKRFARVNCAEGKAAIQVCLTHFYHEA